MGRILAATAIVATISGTLWAANRPGFRGPTGDGISLEKKLPLKWSATGIGE
jgi:hypothetical protein